MGITFFNRRIRIPEATVDKQDKQWVLVVAAGSWLDLLVHSARLNGVVQDERVQRSDDAIALALVCKYDVIVISQGPALDAASLCSRMRDAGVDSPILAMAENGAVHDVVDALDAGADAYLVGPVTYEEFVARLESLQRHPVLEARRNKHPLRVVPDNHGLRQGIPFQEVQR